MSKNKDFSVNHNTDDFNIIMTDKGYKSHRFKKKKRGIAGLFQKIGNGWRNLKKWKKTLITVISILLVLRFP